MNVLMRVACNRPEMLYLSIEAELEAREYHHFSDDLFTIFVVDYGYDDQVLDIIKDYPFPKKVIVRDTRFGLTKNILEGMKVAFDRADDYIIYIEDDILVHRTYFAYLDKVMEIVDPSDYTVIMGYSRSNKGRPSYIHKRHKYTAWGSLIRKDFFNNYISPCITPKYYKDFNTRNNFVLKLDARYEKYWGKNQYKYGGKGGMHNEQAGLINRLVDVAMIEEGRYVMTPALTRAIHIGFYGKNRPGKLKGKSFDRRLEILRDVIDNNRFYEMTQAKQYNDYDVFSPKLEEWDGNLYVVE